MCSRSTRKENLNKKARPIDHMQQHADEFMTNRVAASNKPVFFIGFSTVFNIHHNLWFDEHWYVFS